MTATEQLRYSPVSTSPEQRLLGWGLIGLASLLVVNTLVGPLVLGWLDYELDETLTNQLLGLELVTILLVVPWAGLAGAMALRGHPLAALLGFAPAGYAAYMFVQYLLGPEYDRLGPAPLFHLLITSLAGSLALASWSQARPRPVPLDPARNRARALVLSGLAAFVLLRYVGLLVGAFREEPLAEEYRESVTFFWSIVLLDLGVVVPTALAAALALWHGRDVGRQAFVAVVGWFALVPPSVAAMAVVMFVRDDPNASAATVVLLGVASVVFAGYAAAVHRRLFRVVRVERPVIDGVSTRR
jgi:hypothetical protein